MCLRAYNHHKMGDRRGNDGAQPAIGDHINDDAQGHDTVHLVIVEHLDADRSSPNVPGSGSHGMHMASMGELALLL